MLKLRVNLKKLKQAQSFCNMASQCPYKIELEYGMYTVDAKSLMDILKMPLANDMLCIIHTSEKECASFLNNISSMIIREQLS